METSIEIKEELVTSDHCVESSVSEAKAKKEILGVKKCYTCKFCSRAFSKNGNLTNHLLVHTNEKPFLCSVCNEAFNQKRQLNQHILTHTTENVYTNMAEKCVLNDNHAEAFVPDTKAKKATPRSRNGCMCKFCGMVLPKKCNLKSHLLIHSGKKPFPCNVCDEVFSQECQLNLHVRTHTVETRKDVVNDVVVEASVPDTKAQNDTPMHKKSYSCKFCGEIFSKKCHLKSHLLIHAGEKPFACNVCNEAFNQKRQLNQHIRTHTKEKLYASKKKKQEEEDQSVETSVPVTKVQNEAHPSRRIFTCKYCGKVFSKICNLRSHLFIHTGEKPFACNSCDKAFNQRSHLNLHLRTHTNEKPYTCDVCNKTFSQKSHINKHILTHTKEKPYSCNICNKEFSRKDHLNSHYRTHTARESYYCDICDKKYSNMRSLKDHCRTHLDANTET